MRAFLFSLVLLVAVVTQAQVINPATLKQADKTCNGLDPEACARAKVQARQMRQQAQEQNNGAGVKAHPKTLQDYRARPVTGDQ